MQCCVCPAGDSSSIFKVHTYCTYMHTHAYIYIYIARACRSDTKKGSRILILVSEAFHFQLVSILVQTQLISSFLTSSFPETKRSAFALSLLQPAHISLFFPLCPPPFFRHRKKTNHQQICTVKKNQKNPFQSKEEGISFTVVHNCNNVF